MVGVRVEWQSRIAVFYEYISVTLYYTTKIRTAGLPYVLHFSTVFPHRKTYSSPAAYVYEERRRVHNVSNFVQCAFM